MTATKAPEQAPRDDRSAEATAPRDDRSAEATAPRDDRSAQATAPRDRHTAAAKAPRWHRWLRRASWGFMGTAVLLVGYVGLLVGYQSYQQHRLSAIFDQRVGSAAPKDVFLTGAGGTPSIRPHLADGEPIARLQIARIGFNAVVVEGDDGGVLSSGPGHDDHTSYPGEGGLVLIGNHNGFSMSWGDLHAGDEVVMTTDYGRFHYRIQSRRIVDGGDNALVQQHFSGEHLYLTTCWPLWAGAFAHQRLVFDATPETAP